MTMEVKGRDLVAGIPKTLIISDEEIREALTETFGTIVEAVKIALERTPPELAADIVDKGVVVAGGGSLIKGLDILLKESQEVLQKWTGNAFHHHLLALWSSCQIFSS